ncbi:MAG TPA: elongation factor Ts [Planctomycetota bacterium]|jgi:elongation factor Ts|nr:elongation factor Ts [Planctomycetota bacterium]
MADIDPKTVARLRAETEAGYMACKQALVEADADFDKAKEILRKRLGEIADKKAGKETTMGAVGAYVHGTEGLGRVGALVELGCNTDFVAKSPEFQSLLRDLAVAVAAFDPKYVSKDQIPAPLIEEEKAKYAEDVKGKPPQIAERILEGKMEKNLFSRVCLLHMPYPKEDEFKGTYGELIKSKIGKLGENIVVRRFHRMELGR